MREVTLTAPEFKEFLWPAVVRMPVTKPGELGPQIAVKSKLRDLGLQIPFNAEQQALVEQGTLIYPDYQALEQESLLLVEEEEWRWLKARLVEYLPRISGYGTEDYFHLMQKVDKAVVAQVERAEPAGPRAVGE